MGRATVDEVLLSTGNERTFLTLIYDYIMGLFEGVTCKITIGSTVIDPATPDDMQWNNRTKTNIDFTLKPGVILRFQVYMNASSSGDSGKNTSYNVFFIINGITIGNLGNDGGDTFRRSGLMFEDTDYPKYSANHRRRYLVSKYISDNMFAIWFGNCTRTTWVNSDFFIIGMKDTSGEWRYAGGSGNITNINFYDSDGVNPATLSTIFSYEARNGYLDYISHSSFVSGSTKVFTSADIFDCSAVNIGDTFLLDDTHSYMAIGIHSLVPIDYNIIPPLIDKTITENGTYSAKDDGASGYSEVTVNVISYKNYIKFNGEGIMLPWSINSDYKIEVTFHETTYYNDSAIIGNSIGPSDMHLTEYNNKYYFLQSRNGETSYGTWSAGEHTFIYNNGSGKNTLDDTVVSNFTPYNYSSALYSIGCRGGIKSNVYNGWIKSYKIYSISQDELIHDLRPAIVAGYHCFIDVIDNAIYSNNSIQAVDTIT